MSKIITIEFTKEELQSLEYKIADIGCFYAGMRATFKGEEEDLFSVMTDAVSDLRDFRRKIQRKLENNNE